MNDNLDPNLERHSFKLHPDLPPWVMRFVGVVLAGMLVVVGSILLWNAVALEVRGEHATATAMETRTSAVAFVTRAGERVETGAGLWRSTAAGESVEIVYDRENPTQIRPADDPFAILGAVGAAFLLLPLFFLPPINRRCGRRATGSDRAGRASYRL
ncbi:hypothetical protein E1263_19870 [Kribbella antibiotica]|uniref:DUF3592 domain-containing protein n=1 Tax=Kribbella antibiotica TaxID=190195 RepID=A0A4R4ZIJ6_9ACTN|nr:DUF3592 domain-containing protein [Kribbella antibiotica]TDD58275.1 hypothetical protein E1263_19870 [Kribbella antibiotica]